MYVGTVDVTTADGGDLLVTYNITKEGVYLEEVHLDIFSSMEQFKAAKKVSNGGAIPGKFEYKMSWSAEEEITSHTVRIPKDYVDFIGTECLYIASHAALSNGETAWGGLCDASVDGVTNLDDAKQFPGRNWSVYFEFCLDECVETINYTYAWEDLSEGLQPLINDGDYNDLVIQSDIIKSSSELKITFLATARGAAYDHEFKFKIPMAGINGVFGADAVTNDGTDYTVTVFSSTKDELGEEGLNPYPFSANTWIRESCTPFAYKEVVLTVDNTFSYDSSKPYEPFISVYPSQTVGVGSSYDLYIYEVSGRDTWPRGDALYPNGIIIPADWKWPLERNFIGNAYPDFTGIDSPSTTGWANNLANASIVFDKGNCN